VIVGGVLICVSFLLAVFLNHSAGERRHTPKVAVPGSPAVSDRAIMIAPVERNFGGGGGVECRDLSAAHGPEPSTTTTLVEERCPNRQQ
jgi:hypothetical protein